MHHMAHNIKYKNTYITQQKQMLLGNVMGDIPDPGGECHLILFAPTQHAADKKSTSSLECYTQINRTNHFTDKTT